MCIEAVHREQYTLGYASDHFKTQEMCEKAVQGDPWKLRYVAYNFKTQKMCDQAVRREPCTLKFVPVYLRTGEMFVKKYLHPMRDVPDHLKIQEMCEEAVGDNPFSSHHVPDWFVTHKKIKTWHDNAYYCNNNSLIKKYDGYQKQNIQKASIKKNSCLLLGIPQSGGIGVFWKKKKKRQKIFFDHLIC